MSFLSTRVRLADNYNYQQGGWATCNHRAYNYNYGEEQGGYDGRDDGRLGDRRYVAAELLAEMDGGEDVDLAKADVFALGASIYGA